MTNPGWAYNDKTASRIRAFARKGKTFTWSDVTYDPKAKRAPYQPATVTPVVTAAQAAWVCDGPRLIRRGR